MLRRFMTVLALASLILSACAGDFAGTWRAQRSVDETSVTYELSLSERGGSVHGSWSVDGSRPSLGCVRGSAHAHALVAAICQLDGSVGARDAKDVCPEYGSTNSRFVRRGRALVWQTRSGERSSWSTLVVLNRVASNASAGTLSECKREAL